MGKKTVCLLYFIVILCGCALVYLGVRGNHYFGVIPVAIGVFGIISEIVDVKKRGLGDKG